jgi:hypothetical protein
MEGMRACGWSSECIEEQHIWEGGGRGDGGGHKISRANTVKGEQIRGSVSVTNVRVSLLLGEKMW